MKDLRLDTIFNKVENPSRYIGGEFGSIEKREGNLYRLGLSFPDLYEIGMSNNALRILYGMLNRHPEIACERVFAVPSDMESLLREYGIPLFTLETQVPLRDLDMVAFSMGYELLATNVLQILDLGEIPRYSVDRGEGDPIVLGGGPGITNPLPLAPVFDGVFIGEAEAGYPDLLREMASLKKRDFSRFEQMERMKEHESVWYSGKKTRTRRAVWTGFGGAGESEVNTTYPVPHFRVAHDHGVVEIMRGCPQGCRFCHAGFYYRPYRMKSHDAVIDEVRRLVAHFGYRDITLSSLSSGDYVGLDVLLSKLNSEFSTRGVSFQLPSLRVNSFTLPLLEELSKVKRSGLTFAVETADQTAQAAVNKVVPLENTIRIIKEAYERGWRRAKLYFMVGLPIPSEVDEVENIVQYIAAIQREVPIELSINVGTFIPKPHTPFQRVRQLTEEEATERLRTLKKAMPKRVHLNYHDPFLSMIEGILSRGDERTWKLVEYAYDKGARLDAWDELVKRDVWRRALEVYPDSVKTVEGFNLKEELPWKSITLGIPDAVLLRELKRSKSGITTGRCKPECEETCGVCNSRVSVRDISGESKTVQKAALRIQEKFLLEIETKKRKELLIRYSRGERTRFLSHLAVLRLFERLWYRTGIEFPLSEGYSPKPKFSFAQPLPSGMTSEDEYVKLKISQKNIHLERLYQKFDRNLPDSILVKEVFLLESDKKIRSPMDLFGAAQYRITLRKYSPSEKSPSLNASGSSGMVDRLHAALKETKGVVLDREEDILRITVYAQKAPGINKLLRTLCSEEERSQLDVLRIRSLTKGGLSYPEAYQNEIVDSYSLEG